MIQRIQTIWLFITALFTGLIIKTGIINLTGNEDSKYMLGFSGIYRFTGHDNAIIHPSFILPLLILLIVVLSITAILLFKTRRIQKIVTLIIICLSSVFIVFTIVCTYKVMQDYNASPEPGLRALFPVISLVASLLALRGINKDEKLVRSYDRLR
jgi:glucan phosphoethanolaminetransferase (alkaline phosphatase superfamily)